jgi:hypothetical protein
VRLRQDVLAPTRAMAARGRLEAAPSRPADRIAATRPARSGSRVVDSAFAPRAARRNKTGPNPTDRRKAGSKHHVLTDAHGIPVVARLTSAKGTCGEDHHHQRHDANDERPAQLHRQTSHGPTGSGCLFGRGVDSEVYLRGMRMRTVRQPCVASVRFRVQELFVHQTVKHLLAHRLFNTAQTLHLCGFQAAILAFPYIRRGDG